MSQSVRKIIMGTLAVLGAGFLLIQLVPYGRAHTNPPVVREPNWDSPQTRELAVRACYDCHSNETVYPWYSNIAPASWLLQNHVDEGRQYLNFSEWGSGKEGEEPEELGEVVLEGEMPTWDYELMHAAARLTPAEIDALARGLVTTAGGSYSGMSGGEGGEGYEDGEHEGEESEEDDD